MELLRLVGARVVVMVSDPWEFGTEVSSGPLYGTVLQGQERDLLLSLRRPIQFRSVWYSHLLASPRHAGVRFDGLPAHTQVPASLVLITEATAEGSDPFSRDHWTRGIGLIGSVRLL